MFVRKTKGFWLPLTDVHWIESGRLCRRIIEEAMNDNRRNTKKRMFNSIMNIIKGKNCCVKISSEKVVR